MIACPACHTENRDGARFCAKCGHGLGLACPACGNPYEAGDAFCVACGEALQTVAAAPPAPRETPAAERRLVSILFADLVGFTSLSETRDPEDVRELLSRYFDTCRRLIALYGGTVEKFIGDAVMAVWGTPITTEDDAERAVRAALDLVAAVSALGDEVGAPNLRARAGVLTGEAAVTLGAQGEGMVAGDLVNTASRVQSVAEPGSVFVGEATRRATEPTIVFEAAGEHELKGKDAPLPLWRALRVVSGVRGQLKSGGLEAPFVGRERELRQVKELFHACAQEKKAQLVSITGIAGIGKSRLGWEFYKYFDGIVETVWWHRGRCLAYGEGVTYWALADMVRMRCRIGEDEEPASALEKLRATLSEHLLDEQERQYVEPSLRQLLGFGDGESADRQELFAGWRLFFERLADSSPTVMVFEDLQWADASLLDFIEYLLEWARSHPLYVITLARPELLEQRPTWGAGQRSFTSIYLEPLSDGAMEELLDGLVPGLPAKLKADVLARAEGVPLYAVETVRMLLDRGLLAQDGPSYRVVGEVETLEVPETLQALIAARLDGLSEDERRLLQNGAVLGKTFSRQALAALTGLSEGDLEPLLASLLRKEVLSLQSDPRSPEHGQYGFLQDLVRRVAYDTLARRDRKSRHLAAAEHLSAAFGEEEVAEVIASHLLAAYKAVPDGADAAELRLRAGEALVRAGERAGALAAAAEAQRYFEQAVDLTEDPLLRTTLTAKAGEMAWRASRPVEARALFDAALAAYEERAETRAAARVAARLAQIDFAEGHPQQAVARLEPAVAAMEAGEPDADLAALSQSLGRFLVLNGENDRALPYLERALELAETLDLPETLAHALTSKALTLLHTTRLYEARILLQGALDLALTHDLHPTALRVYNNLTVVSESADDWPTTMALSNQAIELARRVGDRNTEGTATGGLIGSLRRLGRWDEAHAKVTEAMDLAATAFGLTPVLEAVSIHCEQGELGEARQLLGRLSALGESGDPQTSSTYLCFEAALLRAEGRLQEALAAAERASDLVKVLGPASAQVKAALVEVLEAAIAAGDVAKVREVLELIGSWRSAEVTPYLRANQLRFQALLGDEGADGDFEAALTLFAELEMPFEVAVTQLEHAEHLQARGLADEAEPMLAEAVETFERLRAKPWLERAAQAGAGRQQDAVSAGA